VRHQRLRLLVPEVARERGLSVCRCCNQLPPFDLGERISTQEGGDLLSGRGKSSHRRQGARARRRAAEPGNQPSVQPRLSRRRQVGGERRGVPGLVQPELAAAGLADCGQSPKPSSLMGRATSTPQLRGRQGEDRDGRGQRTAAPGSWDAHGGTSLPLLRKLPGAYSVPYPPYPSSQIPGRAPARASSGTRAAILRSRV
jgi:hypothetical protein